MKEKLTFVSNSPLLNEYIGADGMSWTEYDMSGYLDTATCDGCYEQVSQGWNGEFEFFCDDCLEKEFQLVG